MPMMIDNLRAEFAAHIAETHGAASIDKALAHVIRLAYERGLDDGRRDAKFEIALDLVAHGKHTDDPHTCPTCVALRRHGYDPEALMP